MIEQLTEISIRYGETDQMGYVHHSSFVLFLEEARMDLFKSHGLDVIALEKEGVIIPVVSIEIRYVMPLRFGDRISVETSLKPDSKFKLDLKYRIRNQDQKVVAKAKTALVFAEKETGKLIMGFQKYLEPMTK